MSSFNPFFFTEMWQDFVEIGEVLLGGYLCHFAPFFFVDRTLFLHHYLPAYAFKIMLTSFVISHLMRLSTLMLPSKWIKRLILCLVALWLCAVVYVFRLLSVLAYGFIPLTADDVRSLKWRETWDLIIHKP